MKNLSFLIIGIILLSCGNNNNQLDCDLGQPTAIFSDQIPLIESHSFEVNEQNSLEKIEFKSGKRLDIQQSGCEDLVQRFEFTITEKTNQKDSKWWVDETALQFRQLSRLGEQYAAFALWSGAIEANKSTFELSAPQELSPGFVATIYFVEGSNATTLVVQLGTR